MGMYEVVVCASAVGSVQAGQLEFGEGWKEGGPVADFPTLLHWSWADGHVFAACRLSFSLSAGLIQAAKFCKLMHRTDFKENQNVPSP